MTGTVSYVHPISRAVLPYRLANTIELLRLRLIDRSNKIIHPKRRSVYDHQCIAACKSVVIQRMTVNGVMGKGADATLRCHNRYYETTALVPISTVPLIYPYQAIATIGMRRMDPTLSSRHRDEAVSENRSKPQTNTNQYD
jgi:hypothetical protein